MRRRKRLQWMCAAVLLVEVVVILIWDPSFLIPATVIVGIGWLLIGGFGNLVK